LSTILFLCFGLGLAGAGYMNMLDGFLLGSKILILTGIVLGWYGFFKLTKGV
jgi:hypothetical protein